MDRERGRGSLRSSSASTHIRSSVGSSVSQLTSCRASLAISEIGSTMGEADSHRFAHGSGHPAPSKSHAHGSPPRTAAVALVGRREGRRLPGIDEPDGRASRTCVLL